MQLLFFAFLLTFKVNAQQLNIVTFCVEIGKHAVNGALLGTCDTMFLFKSSWI